MDSSIWIKWLRTFNTIIFFAILLGGVISGVVTWIIIGGFVGFLCFIGITLGGFLLSFLSVSVVMIFLDIAEDVSFISNKMQNLGEIKRTMASTG